MPVVQSTGIHSECDHSPRQSLPFHKRINFSPTLCSWIRLTLSACLYGYACTNSKCVSVYQCVKVSLILAAHRVQTEQQNLELSATLPSASVTAIRLPMPRSMATKKQSFCGCCCLLCICMHVRLSLASIDIIEYISFPSFVQRRKFVVDESVRQINVVGCWHHW